MPRKKDTIKSAKFEEAKQLRWKIFCRYYVNGNYGSGVEENERFGIANATRSYMKAYPKATLSTADMRGPALLGNARVKEIMRKTLENSGFNNEAVDSRLKQIVFEGKDADSNTAIKEYNRIVGRGEDPDKKSNEVLEALKVIDSITNKKENV